MLIRDEKYYFDDGSCIFRVDDYLFNIHRSLLKQESHFFEKMFTLPQPEALEQFEQNGGLPGTRHVGIEGSSDENPVCCQDSIDSFRALCWALYAGPAEIRTQDDPKAVDLDRLILLAHIAHKYECENFEGWSLDVIQTHWKRDLGSPPGTIWTLDIIEKLLILSIRNDTIDSAFRKEVELRWLSDGITRSRTPSDLRRALNLADNLESPRLRGLAYYHVLRRVGLLGEATIMAPDISQTFVRCSTPDSLLSDLTQEQHLKLMRGLWCLVSLRCYSLANTPFNDRCPECNSPYMHQLCLAGWRSFWTSYNSGFDFGKMLEAALLRANGQNQWGNSAPCWRLLKPKVEAIIHTFEENLSTYFVLP